MSIEYFLRYNTTEAKGNYYEKSISRNIISKKEILLHYSGFDDCNNPFFFYDCKCLLHRTEFFSCFLF